MAQQSSQVKHQLGHRNIVYTLKQLAEPIKSIPGDA
jgi:hypothetical protein